MEPWFVYFIIGFFVFDILLVVFILYKKSRSKGFAPQELQYIKSHWIRIIDRFNSHTKEAILDADKLLDYALARKGFEGNLGEKLKKAGPRLSDLNGIWAAHKLRNKVAHELLDIDRLEAKNALVNFKKALNELGADL